MLQLKEISALGTLWWFDLFDTPPSREREITDCIVHQLRTFEHRYSRFSDTSLIGILNKAGTLTNPSDELISLLQFGQMLYEETGGIFNFLSAHTQVARGYGSATGVREAAENPAPANPITDLVLNDKKIMLHRGAVDLGGFGKGWLIDAIAGMLRTSLGVHYFLINGGGDIYASTLPDGLPIDIFIEHPFKKKCFIAKVPLFNQGFAGSGTHKRRWRYNGIQQHHIIAQHTTAMASHIVAHTALYADVFATVACAVTPSEAPGILEKRGFDYLLAYNDCIAHSEHMKQCFLFPDDA